MKCPLLYITFVLSRGENPWIDSQCIQGNCAWWNVEHNQCDSTGMLPWLVHIESRLTEIVEAISQASRLELIVLNDKLDRLIEAMPKKE